MRVVDSLSYRLQQTRQLPLQIILQNTLLTLLLRP
jgi:hypothetical protein